MITMKFCFHINYRTNPGESLAIDCRFDGNTIQVIPMHTNDGINWIANADVETGQSSVINYHYRVVNEAGETVRTEWHLVPHMCRATGVATHLHDLWHDPSDHSPLYSSAFTDCLFRRDSRPLPNSEHHFHTILTVMSAQAAPGKSLRLVGSPDALGGWNPSNGLAMHEIGPGLWQIGINSCNLPHEFEFKFVAMSADGNCVWENGDNRRIAFLPSSPHETTIIELREATFSDRMPRVAGTVVPVFSLRSQGGFGVGDFGDLKMMIDWVSMTGQHALQILPVNDTTISHTWTDSYPYNSISIYALHPQYVDLRQLPSLKDKAKHLYYEDMRMELNSLPQIDYEQVNKAKIGYLRDVYHQIKSSVCRRATYKQFVKANGYWLEPYARYCHNRDKCGTTDFSKWTDNGNSADDGDIKFWYFVQYVLDQQLKSAHDYARSKKVILKGDIPIGISRNGVEAWIEPRYFNLNSQAGAPPDAFSTDGQNWGFPTYNWTEMKSDGYNWWQRRFTKMSEYFDAYRIDHILGFFRIWDIPADSVTGLLGQFSPSLGMNKEEIETYGFDFDEQRFCDPYVTDEIADRLLGTWADEAKARYMVSNGDGTYSLIPKYSTQRAIERDLNGDDNRSRAIKKGMYAIISNVIFVRDRRVADLYHPRIALQKTLSYDMLSDDLTKQALDRLHNDYFYHRHNRFWQQEAMQKLPALTQCTRMLTCAEDLGMVPDCVPQVMNSLKILTLEIQRMPKKYGYEFSNLAENPYLSVSTISTHDMSTLRQWWDEDPSAAQRYYNNVLRHNGDAPHPLPPHVAGEIVSAHLASPSMLCMLSLQDWLAIDQDMRNPDANTERINDPANPHHYWRWRMHLTIENLKASTRLNENIQAMIESNGRRL